MLWLPLVIVAAGTVGVAYLVIRKEDAPIISPIPGTVAAPRLRLKARAVEPGFIVSAAQAKPVDAPPSPGDISEANGWEAVWVDDAATATMQWGACVWDLIDKQTKLTTADEDKAVQALVSAIGKTVEYVIGIVKAATADVSFCFYLDIPAARWQIGSLVLYTPCEPLGGNPDDIAGWNPSSSRAGFPGKIGTWPLGKMPAGSVGGAWLRNLGDVYGWGEDVYQLVAMQNGVWKSFPAMRRAGWRTGLVLGGERTAGGPSGFGATEDGEYKPGIVPYFKANRCPGQSYKLTVDPFRTKAMNRFE